VLLGQCRSIEPDPDSEPKPEPEITTIVTTEPSKKCGRNERYICGSDCGQSCKLFTDTVQESCPPDCKLGCYCDEGLYRDIYDNCVPQDQV